MFNLEKGTSKKKEAHLKKRKKGTSVPSSAPIFFYLPTDPRRLEQE